MKNSLFIILPLSILLNAGCSSNDASDAGARAHEGKANHHMHKRSFDELVKDFESPDRDTWQKPAKVFQFMGQLKGKTIVDIGAGTGYFVFQLKDSAVNVVAADPDDRFLEYMAARLKAKPSSHIQIRKAAYNSPPVNTQEADLVYMIDVYHHIENRVDYFSQLRKGLKHEGSLVIVDFKKGDLLQGPPDAMKIAPETIIKELNEAGFNFVALDTTSLPFQFMLKMN